MPTPRRALVLVDVQNEYFTPKGPLEIYYPNRFDSLGHITRAIDFAEQQGIPIVSVQHEYPVGAPVFAVGSEGWKLHPEVASRRTDGWKHVVKHYSSVFADTDFEAWLRQHDIDTITLVGYMSNNCELATAAAAEPLGITVELLSDASGAIHLANAAGAISAEQLHEALMVLLHSSLASVGTTSAWVQAVEAKVALPTSDLGTSARQGQAAFPQHG